MVARRQRPEPPRTTTVRLLPHERRLVEAAAEARGIGPSTYVRLAAVEMARRDVAEPGGDRAS